MGFFAFGSEELTAPAPAPAAPPAPPFAFLNFFPPGRQSLMKASTVQNVVGSMASMSISMSSGSIFLMQDCVAVVRVRVLCVVCCVRRGGPGAT